MKAKTPLTRKDILEMLRSEQERTQLRDDDLTHKSVAAELGINHKKAARILSTLVERGILRKVTLRDGNGHPVIAYRPADSE